MIMVLFKSLNLEIRFNDGKFPVLVLENKAIFRSALAAFLNDCSEDAFVFSRDFTSFDFSKKGMFILDPVNPDVNNRKVISKINDYLCSAVVDQFSQEAANINSDIFDLAEKLLAFSSFELAYDSCEIDALSIIKMLSFHMYCDNQSPCELFVSYVRLLAQYLNCSLFVAANLHVYFTLEEIDKIYETLNLNHIKLLVIEQNIPCCSKYEELYIIDKDLCLIDKADV